MQKCKRRLNEAFTFICSILKGSHVYRKTSTIVRSTLEGPHVDRLAIQGRSFNPEDQNKSLRAGPNPIHIQ